MKVLVSICNKGPDDQNPGIFLVEIGKTGTGDKAFTPRPLRVEDSRMGIGGGFTGLTTHGRSIYAVTNSTPAYLVQMSRHYQVKRVWVMEKVLDAHSLVLLGSRAYVVSTGNDSIVEVNLRTGTERVVWKHGEAKEDTIHVNSLMFRHGRFLATMFGPKQGSWRTTKEGMVYDVGAHQMYHSPIHHPHSLCRVVHPKWNYAYWRNLLQRPPKKYYFCESWAKTVRSNKGDCLNVGKGYTRGLAITDEYLFVGLSQSRKKSKSTGQANLDDPTWANSISGVCVYRVNFENFGDSELVQVLPFEEFGNEIYDILPLAG
jgi:hypothetical protein